MGLRGKKTCMYCMFSGNVFYYPNIQSNACQTCHVADHDARGSWMRVRSELWRRSTWRVRPSYVSQPQICRPALYARPALFSRCQIFFLNDRQQPQPTIQRIKGSTSCHTDRKMSTNTKCNFCLMIWTLILRTLTMTMLILRRLVLN